MMWARRTILWPVCLIIATLLSCYSLQVVMRQFVPNGFDHSLPDAYATDVWLVNTNESGHVEYTVKAKHYTHYPQNNYSLFANPVVTIQSNRAQPESPWLITAEQGEAYASNDRIRLDGHVQAQQATTLLMTDHITIHQKQDRAETDAHVTMQTPDGLLEADGLSATLSTKYIKLLSHVKGQYVSQTSS